MRVKIIGLTIVTVLLIFITKVCMHAHQMNAPIPTSLMTPLEEENNYQRIVNNTLNTVTDFMIKNDTFSITKDGKVYKFERAK